MTQVNEATSSLKKAISDYNIANASAENPYEMTNLIINPSFEANQNDNQSTIEGWTKENTANSSYYAFVTRNDSEGRLANGEGNIYFQYWSENVMDFSIAQTISDLPNGQYRVTAAAAFTQGAETPQGYYLYANEQTTEIKAENIYTVETSVTNGTLTIGVKAINPSGAKWARADNFCLFYLGYDTNAAIQALTEQKEAAENLLESAMSSTVKQAVTEAITQAQDLIESSSTTVNEAQITEVSTALTQAVENAEASISSYKVIRQSIDKATEYKKEIQVEDIDAINTYENLLAFTEQGYTNGTLTEDAVTMLETAMITYMKAQTATANAPADYSLLLQNPEFSTGDITGWNTTQNSTGGYSDGVINDETHGMCYYYESNTGHFRHATIYQTISTELEAGVYGISADVWGKPLETTGFNGTFIYATTGNVNHWAQQGSEAVFEGYVAINNLTQTETWENIEALFNLTEPSTSVRIGILSWGYNVANAEKVGYFRANNFKLYYYGKSIIKGEKDLIVKGAIEATELNEHLTTEVTSVDIREASINNPGDIKPQNPNTIIYGLPAENEREVELQENYAFNAPEEINVRRISYTRVAFSNNEDSKVNNETLRGWQTICLPFDVTSISAVYEYNTSVPLAPIMSSEFDNGVDDSNVNYSHPFWLYAIDAEGQLSPAAEIKANVPYLMLIPNDPDYYAEFYNIAGDITFTGETIAATALTEQEGKDGQYNLIGYFDGAAETLPTVDGKTYYALDAEGANFVQTDFAPIASFRAFATLNATPQSAPQLLSIFGDGDGTLTALPTIKEALGDRAQSVTVYTAKGGIRIESAKDCTVNVYSIDGALLQTVTVSAGGNEFVALPAGKYIANGSVVIAQ